MVGVYNGSELQLYVNGVLNNVEDQNGTIVSGAGPFWMGKYCGPNGSDWCYYGKIDEVAIYNRALTADEIQQHYEDGLNGLGYEELVWAVAGGPYQGLEDSPIPLDDASASEGVSYSWSVDSSLCEFSDASGLNPTLTCDDNGDYDYVVTLTVDDGVNDPVSDNATVTVDNVAPTATFNAPTEVNEGSDINLSLSAPSDPSSADTAAGFEYAFDCGGGAGYGGFSSSSSAVCPTDDNGIRAVRGKIRDKDGGETEYAKDVTVLNVAPTVGEITAPVDPVQVGTEINASADFTDPGVFDTHTAVWDWGNESTSAGNVTETDGSGSVAGNHTYDAAGVYTIKLTVTDKDLDSGVSPPFQFVVVYDPAGGFVTGGGWIDSPEGAYASDPLLTGKANFGFASKYKKGADVPTGQTQFRFRVADLNFHSTSYQWLVVAGPKAQFKGDGTINGAGNYGFMLTALDAELTPSAEVDKFRIKIWDKDNGDAIVYDNKMGDADDADDITDIGGGSIVIHKGK